MMQNKGEKQKRDDQGLWYLPELNEKRGSEKREEFIKKIEEFREGSKEIEDEEKRFQRKKKNNFRGNNLNNCIFIKQVFTTMRTKKTYLQIDI